MMALRGTTVYRASEFAELAGVTVRTLHHYDRLGLLKPKKRSTAGYRLYQLKDRERVEEICGAKVSGAAVGGDPAGSRPRAAFAEASARPAAGGAAREAAFAR